MGDPQGSKKWFYTDQAATEHGPVSADELRQLLASGTIHPQTDIWTEGMDEWVYIEQIEGMIPAESTAPPPIPHQPQINLGPTAGINLASTIAARPMGHTGQPPSQAALAPYVKTPKSPVKKIILGIVALVVIGFGIMISITPSEEEKIKTIPGYGAYSKANKLINSTQGTAVHGNSSEAITIGTTFSKTLKAYRDLAVEKASPGLINKEGTFPTFCLALTEGEKRTVVILVQVPKLRKFAQDAKQSIVEGTWFSAKLALAETPYSDPNTTLVVAIRGMLLYEKVLIGHPIMTENSEENLLEGVKETHDGSSPEEKLYPYFIKIK